MAEWVSPPLKIMARVPLILSLLALLPASALAQSGSRSAEIPGAGDSGVVAILKEALHEQGIPAMAAAIVTSEGLTTIGTAGYRKRGTDIPVTLNDKWHLGSNTKAMTATLIAKLVELKKLRWETTTAEIYRSKRAQFHPVMRDVNFLHLLSHHAGLPHLFDLNPYGNGSGISTRRNIVRAALAKAPETALGKHFEYSNLGFIVAGAMTEEITGQSWEDSMKKWIFRPLEMKNSGFGGTGTPRKVDQPWPHLASGKPTATNGPEQDNLPSLGPAGRVHCTMEDWTKFVTDHLAGLRGKKALLQKSSYQTLITPPFPGSYALGWVVHKRAWAGGNAINHNGSNTMNYSCAWMSPKRDFAVLVCTNQGGDLAARACDDVAGNLIQLHLKRTADRMDNSFSPQ